MPADSNTLLHVVEAVHYALFLAMTFYFVFVLITTNVLLKRFNNLATAEAVVALHEDATQMKEDLHALDIPDSIADASERGSVVL